MLRSIVPAALLATLAACATPPAAPTPPAVGSVTVSPESSAIMAGDTATLAAVARDPEGATLSDATFTWQSSDPEIASVSAAGQVTGVAVGGPVSIIATADGVVGTANVAVLPASPVAQIVVTPDSSSVTAGHALRLHATAFDSSANRLFNQPITWMSENHAIAAVSSDGLVTGINIGGPVAIVASSAGRSDTAFITVH
jgi:uncharacterized protein YjdB